jgi:hypothetical protein
MALNATPAPDAPAINAAQCPLCSQPNQCAMEQARLSGQTLTHPCWCTNTDFSAALLASVPAPAQRLSCICVACTVRSGNGSGSGSGNGTSASVVAPHA